MSQPKATLRLIVILIFLAVSSSGCEIVDRVKEFFQKPKQTASTPQSAPPTQANKAVGPLPANVLARIGNWTITAEQFQDRLAAIKELIPEYDIQDKEARKMVLEELVRQQLLVIDAERSGLANKKDVVDAVEEFRRTLIVREVAQNLTKDIEVSTAEALSYYNEQKDLLVEPEQFSVSELVVKTQEEANDLLIEILKGTDFAEMAKEHSISDSAENGGNLGFLKRAPFPEFVNAILPLEQGQVSSVFKGPDGFYIVKLDERKSGRQISFEEVKEDILQNRTVYKQQQAVIDYIEKLKQNVKVEINEDLL